MQAPAHKFLITQLIEVLNNKRLERAVSPRILNIGAGRSLGIEKRLTSAGCNYICDRLDIDIHKVEHPFVDKFWNCSVESMTSVNSNRYFAVFANYVLEHVFDLHKASREIYRVLKPSGRFIASIPNPTAPEFQLAKHTPLWFHKMIRRGEAWETFYSYKNIRELNNIFILSNFNPGNDFRFNL